MAGVYWPPKVPEIQSQPLTPEQTVAYIRHAVEMAWLESQEPPVIRSYDEELARHKAYLEEKKFKPEKFLHGLLHPNKY